MLMCPPFRRAGYQGWLIQMHKQSLVGKGRQPIGGPRPKTTLKWKYWLWTLQSKVFLSLSTRWYSRFFVWFQWNLIPVWWVFEKILSWVIWSNCIHWFQQSLQTMQWFCREIVLPFLQQSEGRSIGKCCQIDSILTDTKIHFIMIPTFLFNFPQLWILLQFCLRRSRECLCV